MVNNEEAALRKYVSEGLSNVTIGEKLGVTESTIRRRLKAYKIARHLIPLEDVPHFVMDTPLVIESGPVAIAADFHMPLTNWVYLNTFIQECRDRGIKRLLAAGDWWNFDSLSQYDPKQSEAHLALELNVGLATMRVLLETFDEIDFIWGNHDARLHKALGYKMRFDAAMRLVFGRLGDEALERIRFSNLDHAWVDSPRGRWYVCHPANYSRAPLTSARALAAIHGCNVITAHSHHCAVGYALDGKHVVAEAGGFFDRKVTAYLQRSTTFPKWTNGYALLDGDGILTVRSPGFNV